MSFVKITGCVGKSFQFKNMFTCFEIIGKSFGFINLFLFEFGPA